MTSKAQTQTDMQAAVLMHTGVVGSTAKVLAEIAAERMAQERKFGQQDCVDADPEILQRLKQGGPNADPVAVASRLAAEYEVPTAARAKFICENEHRTCGYTWVGIALEEFCEAIEAVVQSAATGDDSILRTEVIQCAAVFTKWAEAIDRRNA